MRWRAAGLLLLCIATAAAQVPKPSYKNALVVAPLFIEYTKVSDEKFASEAQKLRDDLHGAPHVLLGFSTFVSVDYDREPNVLLPVDGSNLKSTFREIDTVVARAMSNGLVAHIGLVSGSFHGFNKLRESAIRQDVRNAQWFSDGWIGPPEDLSRSEDIPRSVWLTPSRYAKKPPQENGRDRSRCRELCRWEYGLPSRRAREHQRGR